MHAKERSFDALFFCKNANLLHFIYFAKLSEIQTLNNKSHLIGLRKKVRSYKVRKSFMGTSVMGTQLKMTKLKLVFELKNSSSN
jgi:hypothetical protein